MEQLQHYKSLYQSFLRNNISEVEKVQLMNFFDTASDQEIEFVVGTLDGPLTVSDLSAYELRTKQIFERISAHTKPKTKILWKWIAAAAALILAAGISLVIYLEKKEALTFQQNLRVINDVSPGGKKATLTLGDGRTIALDSVGIGRLFEVGGSQISKTASGEITYQQSGIQTIPVQKNTIEVPRGGEYQLQLPDGTKVWLNAQTTISYPTKFVGSKRSVSLSGEAYFEVAKDALHPFIVESQGQQVEVLGTHFNIKAYPKSRTVTTLQEGSVRVSALEGTKRAFTIKPGQQVVLKNGSLGVAAADLQSTLAWKNGLIFFDEVPLDEVLDEISRWYDVEVEYRGKPVGELFGGGIYRNSKLSTILRILKLSGVNSKLVEQGNIKKLIIEN